MADFDPVSYMMGQKAGGGGGSSLLVIGGTYDENENKVTLDKTWNEIHNALIARAAIGQIFINFGDPVNFVQVLTIIGCGFDEGIYGVQTDGSDFRCWHADDYPTDPLPPEPEDPGLD